MLSKKQIRMLELLDKQVSNCRKCELFKNKCSVPHWSPISKYMIISECPGYAEIRSGKPFMGVAGDIIKKGLSKAGFDNGNEFSIINSVQCMLGNTKPTDFQLDCCQDYVRKYIKILKPEKILCLGNYAKYIFTGDTVGVLSQRGIFNDFTLSGSDIKYPVLITIHPAYCIYNSEDGIPMLNEDLRLFKDSEFERESDWLFTEEDFLIT